MLQRCVSRISAYVIWGVRESAPCILFLASEAISHIFSRDEREREKKKKETDFHHHHHRVQSRYQQGIYSLATAKPAIFICVIQQGTNAQKLLLVGLVCSVFFVTVLAYDPPCFITILRWVLYFWIVFQHVCLNKQNPRST